MRDLWIHPKDLPRVSFAVKVIAHKCLAARQILVDPSPLWRDLNTSLLDQPPEGLELRRALACLPIVLHEDVILQQEPKLGMLEGDLHGLARDAVAAAQAFLARASPEQIEVGKGNDVNVAAA